jgi:hypothetical protein
LNNHWPFVLHSQRNLPETLSRTFLQVKNVTKDIVQGRLGKVYMPDQQVCIFFNNKKGQDFF